MKLDQPAPGDESTHDKIERYKQRFPGYFCRLVMPLCTRLDHPGHWSILLGAASRRPRRLRLAWAGGHRCGVEPICHRRGAAMFHRFSPYCKIAEQKIETFVRSDTLEPSSAMNENAA